MKQQQCQLCKEKLPKNKLVYNNAQEGYICVWCYKHQFPKTMPAYPF